MARLLAAVSLLFCIAAPCAFAEGKANDEKKKMKMDEPMAGGMMKKGMIKRDMNEASKRKEKDIRPKLEQEERSMPEGGPKR